jgi:hypothetical protein
LYAKQQKPTKVLVVANSFMKWKATKSCNKVGSDQPFYVRILYHEHFGNIKSTCNEDDFIFGSTQSMDTNQIFLCV